MNSPMISIILPVYNTEEYLHKCIDSILAQTFEDFELLLIDDGSSDSSGAICGEYASKDTRVRVFHKSNGGVSSARNVGLENMQGRGYLTFADSDDWMESNWLQDMIDNIEGTDMVIQGFYWHQDGESRKKTLTSTLYKNEDYHSICADLLKTNQLGYLWSMCFRKKIIADNNLRFDERICFQEDLDFVLHYLPHTASFRTVDLYNYHYTYMIGKKYGSNIYGIGKIMHSINLLLDANDADYWKKRYGGSAGRTLLKEDDINAIKAVKQYFKTYGFKMYGKTPPIMVAIIFLFPTRVARRLIQLYVSLLNFQKGA